MRQFVFLLPRGRCCSPPPLKFNMPQYKNCPELDMDMAGQSGTADEAQIERARIRKGCLKGMNRLLLFSAKLAPSDTDNFSHVTVAELEEVPADVVAEQKMNFGQRYQARTIKYRKGAVKKWDSCIFGRAELGERIVAELLQSSYNAFIKRVRNGTKTYLDCH